MKYEKDKDYDTNKKTYAKVHITSFKLLPQGNGQGGHIAEEPGNASAYTGSGRSSDEPDLDRGTTSSASNGGYDDDIPF